MGAVDAMKSLGLGGKNGVLFYPDLPQFELGPSFSISAKVWVRENPVGGTSPAGQIVFRGDDRCGLDNYSLSLGNDGFYTFSVYSDGDDSGGVRAPSIKNRWQTLLGTFDARSKDMKLYIDGVLVSESSVNILPVVKMDSQWTPGFSIGNVQNPLGGMHNQPFNGFIRDVRLYNNVIFWDDLRIMPVNGDRSVPHGLW